MASKSLKLLPKWLLFAFALVPLLCPSRCFLAEAIGHEFRRLPKGPVPPSGPSKNMSPPPFARGALRSQAEAAYGELQKFLRGHVHPAGVSTSDPSTPLSSTLIPNRADQDLVEATLGDIQKLPKGVPIPPSGPSKPRSPPLAG